MADTAFQTQYRQEFIAGFEQGMSLLRATTTTEAVVKGNQATFLVADSGGAEPVTRGADGLIPARPDNLEQLTATLAEWHDKPRRTRFNIFGSQSDGRRIMQMTTTKVMNRKIDQDILSALSSATLTLGAAATMSLDLATMARGVLGANEVPTEELDNMFFVASHAAETYLMRDTKFASADFVEIKPLVGPVRRFRQWAGFNWIFHPRLTGAGTADCTCYAFHRSAIGHAVDSAGMNVAAGYNDEDDYYWARTSMFMGGKLLQNEGVLKISHNDSAIVAT